MKKTVLLTLAANFQYYNAHESQGISLAYYSF